MNLLVWPVGVRGRYLGDGEDFGADDGLVRALHVLEVEDDGVLEEREEDEHDAGQEPDLNRDRNWMNAAWPKRSVTML